jgi:TolB-like protein
MSGDADNEYFGDGLAEELLNALSSIEGLKVAARTSAFAFKGSKMDVRVIGDTLGVATVLEGSVRRSADRIRITAQLIDARTGYHLWSDTYDRPLTDLFTVQDAIAREIVSALAGKFTTSKEGLYRGGTTDVQAYDVYLLGRQKWVTRKVPLLREAILHFEQAIARDSSFALAWSGLADAIDALAWRVPGEARRVADAKYAAQRALLLDAELAEGWASLGVLALDFDRDFRVAELALRRAIALKPSYAAPYNWLADALRYSGRVEESLEPASRGLELDPVTPLGMNGMLQTLTILGRDREARAIADRMRSIGYTDLGALVNMLSAGPRLGYNAETLATFAVEWATIRGYSKPEKAAVIGRAITDPQLRPSARDVLRRMAAERLSGPQLAELSVAVGDLEGAIANLTRAIEERDPTIIVIGTDWAFDPLRRDPRFIRIVEQLGLPNGRS